MKVVFVTSESFIDHSYTIVNELRNHCDLTVFFQAKESGKENELWCKKFNAVFIKRKRFRNPIEFFKTVSFILRLKRLKADWYWFNTLTFYQSLIVKYLINKLLVSVHDVEVHPGLKDFNVKKTQQITLRYYRKNTCSFSKTQSEVFKNKFGFEPRIFQLPVIDYYTELTGYKPEEKQKQIKKINFLFFGTVEPYKGISLLLDAVEILNKINCSFTVNIFGKVKSEVDLFYERIKILNNVNLFDGFVPYDRVYKIYEENDVLVLPYLQVTQCGPLLIGYNQNKPVICNNLPGFREYVTEDKSGIFFDGTAKKLAEQMKRFIDNRGLVFEMGHYISDEIKQKYSMKVLVNDYLSNFTSNSSAKK